MRLQARSVTTIVSVYVVAIVIPVRPNSVVNRTQLPWAASHFMFSEPMGTGESYTSWLCLGRPRLGNGKTISGAMAVQQDCGDLPPFFIRRRFRMGLMRAFVPVTGIVRIPLFAVQVGMDPCRLATLLVLSKTVSAVKISPAIPPKGLQQWRKAQRGRSLAQGGTEFFDSHGSHSTPQ